MDGKSRPVTNIIPVLNNRERVTVSPRYAHLAAKKTSKPWQARRAGDGPGALTGSTDQEHGLATLRNLTPAFARTSGPTTRSMKL